MTASTLASASLEAAGIRRAVLVLCAVVAVAFVGLIPVGMWYDEFFTIAHVRDDGIAFEIQRLMGWSPRPLSEAFVYLYSLAVIWLDRPLIGPALAPLWALLALAVLLPSLLTRRAVVVSAVLGCLFLLGHSVGEVFYWPIGAVAYVPTLAALALLLTLDLAGVADRPAGRAWAVAALLVAATSSEVGALFCAAYCVLAGVVALVTRDRTALWLVLPFLAASAVLVLLSRGRVAQTQEAFGDLAIAHHAWVSLTTAIRSFVLQIVGTDTSTPSAKELVVGAVSKVAFFLGAYLCLSSGRPDGAGRRQVMRLVLVAALMGSAFLMLTAAYYQFGVECCQRHATMRQGYVFISIGALALTLAAWRPLPRQPAGGLLLLLAVAVPLVTTVPKLASDYRHYRRFLAARADTWTSGAGDSPQLIVPQTTTGKIVGGTLVAPGVYAATGPNQDVYAQRVVGFFKKQTGRFDAP